MQKIDVLLTSIVKVCIFERNRLRKGVNRIYGSYKRCG